MVKRFLLEHFRSFVRPTEIELRPITLFFGYNNSGKSAILRGLVSLVSSLQGDVGHPWITNPELTRGASFSDLTSSPLTGLSPHLRTRLEFDDEEIRDCSWTLRFDGKQVFVAEFQFSFANSQIVKGAVKSDGKAAAQYAWVYDVKNGSETSTVHLAFEGLCPQVIGAGGGTETLALLRKVTDFLPKQKAVLQWLAASRLPPPRQFQAQGIWSKPFMSNGAGTLDFLVAESDGGRLGPVGEEVSLWFQQNFTRQLKLETTADRFDLKTQPIQEVASNLARANIWLGDAGEGLSQVLPILVAFARARQGGDYAPRLVCVEEPESHLHPRYHAALAEAMIDTVAGDTPPTLVAETHSENLLLRLQLAVAQKQLSPDRIAVYWIRQNGAGESRADLVTLDSLGRPQGEWPPTVFGEDLRLSRELLILQRAAEKR